MTSIDTADASATMSKKATTVELVLRDLRELLRESLGDDVIVLECETTSLLSKGENYASTMLKVNTLIKRTKNSPEERLALAAKMMPTTEFQQRYFDSTVSFSKEMFVYKTLIPAFRQVEKEAGIQDEDLIDIAPKYYGGRLTMSRDRPDVADEDAVILMENLKEHGYDTMDRMRGLSLDQAKFALRELSRFHALSMALKEKKPNFFEEVKKSLRDYPFEMRESEFDGTTCHTIADICEDPRIAKYEDRIRASIEAYKNWDVIVKIEAEEPWVALSHGDFWVNNMLFRQENGQVKDIKFVDFQITRVTSPMKDLPYFLCTSVRTDVIDNCFDELLDNYYDNLIGALTKIGCNTGPLSRKNFDEQLNKDAKSELLHILFAAKFFTQEFADDVDLNEMVTSLMMTKASNLYLERSWMTVSKFVEKGWI